ncbi:MAG TPA: TIGR02221 family CRISPR-associated protein [Nevskiaceae bacterium]
MAHTLVTFLGRVPRDAGGAYRHACYHFPDGRTASTAFFGFSLRDWLRAERLVVLGTSGSMWDELFDGVNDAASESARLTLMEAAERERVEQGQLEALTPSLSNHRGYPVALRVIPRTRDAADQAALLTTFAKVADGADELSLDVTHGFRHLPMFALVAALYVRALHPGLKIAGLWYGELGDKDPSGVTQAQVHNLASLLAVDDWLSALRQQEWTGSFDGVAKLVETQDAELANHLRASSFLESIHQGQQARGHLRQALQELDRRPLGGAGALVEPALRAHMRWIDEQRLYRRQREHAFHALRRGDYLRAALYGYEAALTRAMQDHAGNGASDLNDYDARHVARDHYRGEELPKATRQAFRRLEHLRNLLAHGNRSRDAATQSAIASRGALSAALEECFAVLLEELP